MQIPTHMNDNVNYKIPYLSTDSSSAICASLISSSASESRLPFFTYFFTAFLSGFSTEDHSTSKPARRAKNKYV